MTRTARPPTTLARLLLVGRAAAVNVLLPLALAAFLTHALHDRLHAGDVRETGAAPPRIDKIAPA